MSIRLAFETKVDLDFLSHGVSVRLVRLIASVQLKIQDGWTRKYRGIVDTGNPVSVIPHFIWSQAFIKWLLPQPTKLHGIGSGSVSGKLAEVILVFADEKHVSLPLTVKAHLLYDDSIPLLIGFEDILTELALTSDFKSKTAYINIDHK